MKPAVITGASSGLGREFVRQFHSVGQTNRSRVTPLMMAKRA